MPRAIRGVLELDCVTSKGDALLLLRQNTYDVLIACERAIDGSGLDLLGRTTRTAVPLKRIFAAAPERLQLLGPRLAPFKVQRTINYPIDLEELWLAIAQVTGDPNDSTDGTIERVVLDERGIPSTGTVPRGPIPPRPPAPLSGLPPAPPPASIPQPVAAAPAPITSASGRYAVAQLQQAVPEVPLRAPPPPRAPPPMSAPTSPPARPASAMPRPVPARAPAPPMQPITVVAAAPLLPDWTPESPPEDDFATVSAQARLGVQQRVVDQATRRKRQRLFTACGIAIVVAGALVFLIEKFYDPAARAREAVVAQKFKEITEQQKVTDDLTMIENDIEQALIKNDLDTARRELAVLIEKAPEHPRREFLEKSIDRVAELAKLSPQTKPVPTQAAVLPAAGEPRPAARPKPVERAVERAPERVVARTADRAVAPRTVSEAAPSSGPRSYGAPIGDVAHETMRLDAPINSAPTTTIRRPDNSFSGRTIEASDNPGNRAPTPQANSAARNPAPATANSAVSSNAGAAGTAVVNNAPVTPPATAPAAAPGDVTLAKIVKRVQPELPSGIPRKTKGYVLLQFNISEAGRTSDVQVVESSPAGTFDGAAMDAVKKWVYEPRKENGVAVASTAKAKLLFDTSTN